MQFTNSATVMNEANLETAAPTGNATSQMLVSGMCEMDREVLALTPVSVLHLDMTPSRSWVAAAFYVVHEMDGRQPKRLQSEAVAVCQTMQHWILISTGGRLRLPELASADLVVVVLLSAAVVRALIKEFRRLGWNLVFERRTALWNVLTEEQDKTETLASWVIPMVPVHPYKPAPLPDHFPQRTHTLSVLSTAKLTNDQLPQGFKDFANPESIGIKIEPVLGDALSDAAWCKRCGIPFRPNIRRWGH